LLDAFLIPRHGLKSPWCVISGVMSVFAYLTHEKFNGSAWLRDALKWDALRARTEPADLGIKTERLPQGGQFVGSDQYDPVLRFHCRVPEREQWRIE
jgi:hypothetical protein